ncbi:MAG: leucine-rich repeat protein [Lachnospiraceae bacterium]|nr:leucine-rich repeat protein [Lachnospiraceae bacterium]
MLKAMLTRMTKKGLFCACAFVLWVMIAFAPETCAEGGPGVTFPTDRAVFQRNADNTADVTVEASYDGSESVKARLESEGNVVADWVSLAEIDGMYSSVIKNVPAGGWYRLVVATFDAAGNETSRTEVEHVGVGEVFITGGQSNSCNFGGEKTVSESDLVSAFKAADSTWQHCEDSQPNNSGFNTGNGGGSPWPTLGDELVDRLGVPVGFCSTGVGGSTINELLGKNYTPIAEAIEKLELYGCRSFLLHQGEADTDSTPNDEYLRDLTALIEKSRQDAGYDMNWFVAQVSYAWSNYNNTAKMEAMKATQRAACNNYNIFVGPTTDDLLGEYRHTDNLHMSKLGLIEHGKRWADVIVNKLFTAYRLEADADVKNGKILQCGVDLYAGNTVKLSAVADEGYYLVPGSFKVTGTEGDIELDGDSFVMRAENLKVKADFAALPAHFGKLLSAIKAAEAINAAEYEQAGIDTLKAAVAAGRNVYSNPSSTEAETSAAAANIENAVKALVKKNTGGQVSVQPPVQQIQTPPVTLPAKGTTVKSGNIKYVITASAENVKTVSVTGLVKKNKTSVTIPKVIKVEGHAYNVTGISKNSFKGAKKLKKITIKSIAIKNIGKNAFSGISSKAKIKVPSKKLSSYKKMIKKSGFKKVKAVIK